MDFNSDYFSKKYLSMLKELKIKIKNKSELTDEDAKFIIEEVLDCLVEVGNGTTDKQLHECANFIFALQDNWLKKRLNETIKITSN